MIFNFMNNLDKLITHFEKFPGIGGRQARRFAFHILTMAPERVSELTTLMQNLQATVTTCSSCQRFYARNGGTSTLCSICSDNNRDHGKLLIVSHDSDIQAIERGGLYDGLYFVLGGMVPLLGTPDDSRLRGGALKTIVNERLANLTEIILAFAVNPDGENTARYVESILTPLLSEATTSPTITQLGRGLSTGSELEYADPETLKNALKNRG